MVSIETRTKSGHGLRETLCYRLFGELQVYRDRECTMMAQSCFKDGAVSLDGEIVKAKGLFSFGHWEPVIIFPVKNWSVAAQTSETLQLLEERNLGLMEINQQLDEQIKARSTKKTRRCIHISWQDEDLLPPVRVYPVEHSHHEMILLSCLLLTVG
ncbi:protein defective in meristem silencing 3 [Phtheirospermum japonicum]|uniref:Protein defective in meristem silencing 3 n=1 Tax=Phtheirospermum japonicum TaxID=374723 RepID=A0A830CPJ0_9LAMI|nr:protein defective in meristem silencing 3 [Phtheirospermum japonicum]